MAPVRRLRGKGVPWLGYVAACWESCSGEGGSVCGLAMQPLALHHVLLLLMKWVEL